MTEDQAERAVKALETIAGELVARREERLNKRKLECIHAARSTYGLDVIPDERLAAAAEIYDPEVSRLWRSILAEVEAGRASD